MSIKSFIGLSDTSIKSVSNTPIERIKTILGSRLNQKKALELTFASIPEVDVFEGVLTAGHFFAEGLEAYGYMSLTGTGSIVPTPEALDGFDNPFNIFSYTAAYGGIVVLYTPDMISTYNVANTITIDGVDYFLNGVLVPITENPFVEGNTYNIKLKTIDYSLLEHWNKFFDLPTNGTPFTSVEVVGNTVKLYGGANITLKNNLFQNDTNLVNVEDKARCIVGAGNTCFLGCTSLTSPDFSSLTTAGYACFLGCTSLTSPDFSSLTTAGNNCFDGCTSLTTIILPSCTALGTTVGSNNVFNAIAGHTKIILTVPSALMTCNSGNPDGDIQDLIANNTMVTITQV